MRRLLPLLVVLLAAGALYLLLDDDDTLHTTGEGTNERDATTETGPGLHGRAPKDAGAVAETLPVGDLSRVAGPDLEIRGRVLTSHRKPLGDAQVRIGALLTNTLDPQTIVRPFVQAEAPLRVRSTSWLASTRTGADGTFVLRVPRHSRLLVRAAAKDLAPRDAIVFAPPEGSPPPVELVLRRGHPLVGVVVRADGAPVAGAVVHVAPQGRWKLQPLASARTDANGAFAFATLAPGYVRVRVAADGLGTQLRSVHVPLERRIIVRFEDPARVDGTLTRGDGAPWSGATVEVRTGGGGRFGLAAAEVDAAGRFRISALPPGEVHDVRVRAPGMPERRARWGDLELPVERAKAGETLKLRIVLEPGAVLAGRVDGVPAGATPVVALVRFRPQSFGEVAHRPASADGAFRFEGLPDGRYGLIARAGPLAARAPENWYDDEPGIHVRRGETRANIVLPLASCGRVQGRVEGLAGGRADILLRVEAGLYAATCALGADDTFAFPAVPPCADARVSLWGRGHELSETLEIVAGRTHEVVLRLPERPRIRGVVTDPDGKPVEGAYVGMGYWSFTHLEFEFHRTSPERAIATDAAGRFDMPYDGPHALIDASSDSWHVTVEHPDYAAYNEFLSETKRAVPTLDQPAEVAIVLQPLGAHTTLRGRVLEPSGKPAVGARVFAEQQNARLETTTDGQGRFVFADVRRGPVSFQLLHESGRFPPPGRHEGPAGGHYGELPQDVVLTLSPARVLSGIVLDADGTRVESAAVLAGPADQPPEDPRHLEGLDDATSVQRAYVRLRTRASGWPSTPTWTDRGGRFRMHDLEPGRYRLLVKPSATSGTGLQVHTFGPFDANARDVVLRLGAGETIQGRVMDEAGRPIPKPFVIAGFPSPKGWGSVMHHSDYRPMKRGEADGTFRLTGLVSGRYDVIVSARGYEPVLLEGTPSGRADLDVTLKRGEAVRGRVLWPDGTPLAGLKLRLAPADARSKARIERLEALGGSGWFHARTSVPETVRTNSTGRFVLDGLISGRYRVTLERSMVVKGHPVFPKTELRTGDPSADIVVKPSYTITGRVEGPDGEVPPPFHFGFGGHKTTVSVEARRNSMMIAFDFIDAQGGFEIGGIDAGTVELYVDAGDKYKKAFVDTRAGARDVLIRLEKKPEKDK